MLKSLLKRFLLWLLKDELNAVRTEVTRAVTAVADRRLTEVTRQLQAIQAIDADFHDTGKVIVICRVGGTDYVKVIDCKREWRLNEYRDLVRWVEGTYGARPRFYDVPRGLGDPREAFGQW